MKLIILSVSVLLVVAYTYYIFHCLAFDVHHLSGHMMLPLNTLLLCDI